MSGREVETGDMNLEIEEYQAAQARRYYSLAEVHQILTFDLSDVEAGFFQKGDMYEATHGQAGGPLPEPPPVAKPAKPLLTTDKAARKEMPIARGVLDYFPKAMAAVAHVSFVANEQHNPGQPMHWARGKSTDHADCVTRHLIERGGVDDDGLRHTAKLAWRALALLQEELEAAGE